MKKLLLLIMGFLTIIHVSAQSSKADSSRVLKLNQQIDDLVVSRNVAALDTMYADDFVFNHGSGRVEGKAGWFTTVARANYPLRQHDSVKVELHPSLAIVKGKMAIRKINPDKTDNYHLRYIRVYVWRAERWQLVSHNTTHEWHE